MIRRRTVIGKLSRKRPAAHVDSGEGGGEVAQALAPGAVVVVAVGFTREHLGVGEGAKAGPAGGAERVQAGGAGEGGDGFEMASSSRSRTGESGSIKDQISAS